jgi:hypothetical protein
VLCVAPPLPCADDPATGFRLTGGSLLLTAADDDPVGSCPISAVAMTATAAAATSVAVTIRARVRDSQTGLRENARCLPPPTRSCIAARM